MTDNYEKMKEKARTLFLSYDQNEIIKKNFVSFDEAYIYVDFCEDKFALDRKTGNIYLKSPDGFFDSDFSSALSIYDLLTHDNRYALACDEYCSISGLNKTERISSKDIGGSNDDEARFIDANTKAYINACKKLGKEIDGIGDLNYEFKVFSFMKMQLRFWKSDEEFPPKLQLMVDKNILSFILFETVYYVAGHLIEKIFDEMNADIGVNLAKE